MDEFAICENREWPRYAQAPGPFAPAAAVQATSAFETLSRHRLRHLVIAPITTIKILTVAPDLCTRRVGAMKRLVIWKDDWLLRLLPAWNEINRFRLRAYEVSLRSHLISDVDRPQNVSSSSAPSELSIDGVGTRGARYSAHNERSLESVRRLQAGLHSFLSMRRIEARRKNASAFRLRFSQSLASLRQRLSHAMVRSTIQRLGKTTNPLI